MESFYYQYKNLLKKHHLRPLRHLGQNFLINKKVLQKIIQAADLAKNDTVLEIGPGLGILTKELAKKAGQVIAVEKDKRMVEILKETLKDYQNIKIIEGDILKVGLDISGQGDKIFVRALFERARRASCGVENFYPPDHPMKDYKVVANLPYYITSPIIRMFLESENPPKQMVLMIQKEVAQRICAKPPKMSLLSVSVQFYAKPEIVSYVSKKSFWPQPKVDSAIIKITTIRGCPPSKRGAAPYSSYFFKIVRAGFSAPRKQLINNLSKGLKKDKAEIKKILLKCGFNLKARPGDLSMEDWVKLVEKI